MKELVFETSYFESSNSDFWDLLNEFFYMNEKFFLKKIKFSKVILKSLFTFLIFVKNVFSVSPCVAMWDRMLLRSAKHLLQYLHSNGF